MNNATTTTNVTSSSRGTLPSVLTVGLARAKHELRSFFRTKEAVFFTLAFPVMLLVLFGAIFGNQEVQPGLKYSQVLLSGIMASGLASVTFVNLAISIAVERDAGDLKRLIATPMPKTSYFIGKFLQTLVTMIIEFALILAVGIVLYGCKLPTAPSRWITFGWVTVLGAAACSLLGIAVSSIPKNAKSAAPIVNFPFVALQFLSGVFISFADLSPTIRSIASIFPLKWIAQGYRSVFLPDSFLKVEPGGSWQHLTGAAVLGGWTIVAALLCIRTFRWVRSDR
jgi:ABC-2 type transport system permease protein